MSNNEYQKAKEANKSFKQIPDNILKRIDAEALKKDILKDYDNVYKSVSKWNLVVDKGRFVYLVPRQKTGKAHSDVIPTDLTLNEVEDYYAK